MAGSKTQSKNNRTKSGAQRAANLSDVRILIPCNNGRNAYVRDPKGNQNPNLATGSDAFTAAIAALNEAGFGAKIRTELAELAADYPEHGWDATAARLQAAGALA